ncbi:MAG: ABC transporter ATP-binding protein [Steroidobacteraceae bacterium]
MRTEKTGILILYRALWRYAAGARGTLVVAMALLLGAQLVMLAVPLFAGRALNVLQLEGIAGLREAALWLAGIVGLTLASWAMHGPGRLYERNVALQIRQRMSGDLIERLVELPLSWHESQHSGATAHRVQQSVNALAGFAESQYVYLTSLVRLVGPLVALWVIEPFVGLTAIAGLVVIAVATTGFDRRMMQLAHVENDAERRYAATLLDSLGNITTLFALRQARAVVALMQQRLVRVFEPLRRSIVINEFKWFSVDLSSRALSCVLVGLFTWLVSRPGAGSSGTQVLLLGSLYMVWEYAQQAGSVVTAIASHFQTFARLQADYSSADIVRETQPAAHLVAARSAPLAKWRSLSLSGLTFRHPSSREAGPSLREVTLTLQGGKRYALIGSSGAGKSTLLRILSGLYVAERVELTLDERRTTDPVAAALSLRTSSTLVPQDAEVYEGTLAENLSLCESLEGLAGEQEFPRALAIAQTSSFVDASPSGLATRIDERGANWSGGQRSRLALARGVLAAKGSPLVLLDEPTASLDAVTEAAVYDALFKAFPEACIVSSVHRMNLLPRFDEIVLMRAGAVVAQGTLATLQRDSVEFQQLLAAYDQSGN